jgi:hypothetical protein
VERREYPAPISILLSCETDVSHFDTCFTTVPISEGLTAPNSRFNPGTPSPPPGAPGKKAAKKNVTPKRVFGDNVVERIPVPPFPPVGGGDVLETAGDSAKLPDFDSNLFRGFSFTHPDLEPYFDKSDRVLYSPQAVAPAVSALLPSLVSLDLSSSGAGSVDPAVILDAVSSVSVTTNGSGEVSVPLAETVESPDEVEEDKALVSDILAQLDKVSSGPAPSVTTAEPPTTAHLSLKVDATTATEMREPVSPADPSPSRKLALRADAPEFKPITASTASVVPIPMWPKLPVATPMMTTRPVNAWQSGRLQSASLPATAAYAPPVHPYFASGGGRGVPLQAAQRRAVYPARS